MSGGCSTTTTTITQIHEEPAVATSSATRFDDERARARQRRRHSSYQPRAWSADRENVQQLLDRFLVDLGRRLEMMESYGHLKIDEGMTYAYDTLRTLHESCAHVSDEVMDAGRRRAKVLVDTLDANYRGALARKETLEQKVQEGVKIAESLLAEFEKKAYNNSIAATASEMIDTGKAYVEGATHAAAEMVQEGADAARRAKKLMQDKIEEALVLARKQGLINYESLPEPWKGNPHILKGYRFSASHSECVKSCFTTFSNETVNIWSHGLGFLLILSIAFYFYPNTPEFTSATTFDIFIAGCFFFAACKCMICSTMWHTMSSISNQTVMERFACVDYTGISFLVAASIMTTEYTAFYCEPTSRSIYLGLTFVLGVIGSILPWHPYFNTARLSWMRVAFFVGLATTGFVPILQLTLQRSWAETIHFYMPILKSVGVYLAGAILYAAEIPERWMPGAFDYVGGSHQIWHFAVLGGILFHYFAMNHFFSEAFKRASEGHCSGY